MKPEIKAISFSNKLLVKSNVIAPFPESRIKVRRAQLLFPVRSTFVAPIFPEPIFLMSSVPQMRVMISPKGIDPMR